MLRIPRAALPLAAAFLLALAPSSLLAQRMGGPPPGSDEGGWSPIQIGVHGGYDYNSTGSLLGAQVRIPVLPAGWVEIMPSTDVTFLTGLKEYEYNLEAVVVSGGRRGGFYAGGGLGWRNTIYDDGAGRETRTAGTVVVGLKTAGMAGPGISVQIESRWIFVRGPVKPRALTFGVNLPLWGWGRR